MFIRLGNWGGVGWGGGGCTNVHVVVLPGVKMLQSTSWDMVACW